MTLTTKGMVSALGAGLGLFGGLALDNPLFLAVGLLLAALLVVGALMVRTAVLGLRRSIGGDTANEGDAVAVELRIEATRRHGKSLVEIRDALPGEVELADGNNYALLDLKPGEVTTLKYSVRCPIKGFHELGPVRVRVEDPFGLFHRDAEEGQRTTIKVYPKVEDLKDASAKSKYPFVVTGPFLVGNPGTGSAFFALREYNRGDSMRDVNWKASARSKSLVVNQRERESQSEITMLLDARGAGVVGTVRDNTFLYSCRATASLTDFFLGNRSRVHLMVYGDGIMERVNRSVSQQVGTDILEAVTRVKPAGETSLEKVVDEILPTLKPRTPLYLLSSLVDDPGVIRAVATLRAYDVRVMVISPSAEQFALAASGNGASQAELEVLAAERQHTVAALRGMGALVLDWQPGTSLVMSLLSGVV